MNEFQQLLDTLNQKFDVIEAKLNYLLARVEGGCYLCGNRTSTCKLTDCPHVNTNTN